MDHLPQTSLRYRGNQIRHPGTKLLTNFHDQYPQADFEKYPELRGFSADTLRWGTFDKSIADKAAAVLQNWLFFGSMEDIFRERVATEDFVDSYELDGQIELFLH